MVTGRTDGRTGADVAGVRPDGHWHRTPGQHQRDAGGSRQSDSRCARPLSLRLSRTGLQRNQGPDLSRADRVRSIRIGTGSHKSNQGIDRIIAKQKASGAFGYWDRFDRAWERFQPYAVETLMLALPFAEDHGKTANAIDAGLDYLYRLNVTDVDSKLYAVRSARSRRLRGHQPRGIPPRPRRYAACSRSRIPGPWRCAWCRQHSSGARASPLSFPAEDGSPWAVPRAWASARTWACSDCEFGVARPSIAVASRHVADHPCMVSVIRSARRPQDRQRHGEGLLGMPRGVARSLAKARATIWNTALATRQRRPILRAAPLFHPDQLEHGDEGLVAFSQGTEVLFDCREQALLKGAPVDSLARRDMVAPRVNP